MKILITGGTGFIGFYLASHHAQKGDEVVVMDNFFKTAGVIDPEFQQLMNRPGMQWLNVDMTRSFQDTPVPARFDVVYHLAAINGTRLFYEIPYQVARTNLLLTLNLLDWLEKVSVGRLVYTSTSEVYADAGKLGVLPIPTDETVPAVFTQPMDDRFSYGASKFIGEFLCLRFGRQFQIPASVVRYHNIYGPRMGQKHVIPEFIERVQKKENPFKLYGGNETRAFCFVDDAVRATAVVAQTPACAGEIVHIGKSDEEIHIAELAERVLALMQFKADIVECGGRSGSVARRCPDTSKLKRLTGFEAATSLQEGLEQTIRWSLKTRSSQ